MKLTDTFIRGRCQWSGKIPRLVLPLLLLLSLSNCAQLSGGEEAPDQATTEQSAGQPSQTVPAAQSAAAEVAQTPAKARPMLESGQQQQFATAKQYLREQEYQAALSLLQPLAQALPDAAGIHYNLALCYWQLQQTEQARAQLTALLEHQPEYVEAANLLGVIAREAGDFNQARRYWLDALAQQSDFAKAHKNLGFLYELYLAQPEQARYHYQQYQQLSGDPMAEAWLSLLEQQE
ncbi:tetratricopeptide repeat protein [Arsukibacterium indicum]|uniref:Tetratricopeptide repeat protein n=1 Tax=Arsukibacterium indicum TaxID=2848612 RepID=A0ABS6MHM3_9GAMM|nr:tetratricopeptide repeat protein [Arsukibacterium indicum]MBV2128315.1 tetratricopeptide repeat protein [Arsukibacterium indicum]